MDVHAPGSDLSEFKAYIVSQLLWNSSRELGAMASEFLNGYYGLEGGVAVKNYMDTMTGSMKKEGYCRADDGQGVSFPVTSPFLSPAALLTSAAGFSQGLQASKTTPLYYDRLKRASMSTWFVILVRWDEMQQFASEHKVVWPMETTKRQAYVSYLAGANISAAMNGMFCWRYGGSKSSCWTTASDPWRTTGYLWQQVFNHSRLWCLPEKGPNACVYNWTSHRPCCDHCGDHPISNICLNDTRDPGSRGRRGITTAVPSYTLLKTDEAVVSFSPPVFLPNVTCTYCANWRTYRAGKTENSWQTAIIGDGRGHVSSDGGRTVIMVNDAAGGNPFVTMPDGSLHNTGVAGNMDGFHNTTQSVNLCIVDILECERKWYRVVCPQRRPRSLLHWVAVSTDLQFQRLHVRSWRSNLVPGGTASRRNLRHMHGGHLALRAFRSASRYRGDARLVEQRLLPLDLGWAPGIADKAERLS